MSDKPKAGSAKLAEMPSAVIPPVRVVKEFPFTLRSLTLKDVTKLPGAQRYSSREFGVPYATVDLDWPGTVKVTENEDPLVELAEGIRKLMLWLQGTGTEMGREVMASIGVDQAQAQIDDVPVRDIKEL